MAVPEPRIAFFVVPHGEGVAAPGGAARGVTAVIHHVPGRIRRLPPFKVACSSAIIIFSAGLRTPEIDADARAAGDAGIAGTPAFLIVAGSSAEGYFIEGAQSYWSFRKAIARALGEGP